MWRGGIMRYEWIEEYLLDPDEGEFLRSQYEDIIPGYYCNKKHWNSVKPDGNVPV